MAMTNEVTHFMIYMNNGWNKQEAVEIFGEDLGNHIYGKWVYCRDHHLGDLIWYAELDSRCRQKVVDRANAMFSNN